MKKEREFPALFCLHFVGRLRFSLLTFPLVLRAFLCLVFLNFFMHFPAFSQKYKLRKFSFAPGKFRTFFLLKNFYRFLSKIY